MNTKQLARFLVLFLVMIVALSACRRGREEAQPTPAATAEPVATEAPATEPAPEPTEPPAEPTPAPISAIPPEAIDWPPEVLAGEPAPGEEAPLDATVTILFDQPMDQASVEQAFSIEPVVDGDFSWPQANALVFKPATSLARGQSYLVRLSDAAAGLNGQTLPEPVDIAWETVGFFNVSQTIPEDGARNVSTDSVVTVVFDRPVVPLVATGDQADLPQPLTFNPPLEGRGEWTSTSVYRYFADPALAGATTYQVTVDPELQNFAGGVLENEFSWQFTTASPEVVTIQPENERVSVVPTTPITVTFNMPMDRPSTEGAISITTDDGASIPVSAEWQDGDRVVVLDPTDLLPLGVVHTVNVSTAARSAGGQASLDDDTSSTFTTVPFPGVKSTQPADGSVAEQWQRGFSVEFASPMDEATLEDRIIIDPAPEDVNYFFNTFEGQFSLYTDFPLERNTTYTITIPGDAADPYGNTMGEDYTWSFTTPPFEAVVSYNLPREVAQVTTSFPTTVEVIYRNIDNFTAALYDQPLDIDLLFNTYQLYETPPEGPPIREFNVPVSAGLDEVGVAEVALADGGVLPTGLYRLTASSPDINPEDTRFWQNQNVILVVADTNIVVKEMFGEVNVWVTDLASGQPVAGRNLTLYNRQGEAIGNAVSDAGGFARFDYQPTEPYLEGVVVVSNEPGQAGFGLAGSYWNGGVSPWQMGLNASSSPEEAIFAYIYTDRPIYRPGDTVYYKGIVRQNNFGRYFLPDLEEVTVNVGQTFFSEDAGWQPTITAPLDQDGVFYGELVLPEDVRLGNYQFTLSGDYYQSSRSFTVAEYRAPEFLVTLTPEREEALRGEAVNVNLQAEYLFGAPAADLEVAWNVYEMPYTPEFPGAAGYAFGDQGDFFYEDRGPFGNFGVGELGNYVVGESGLTDASGRLVIPLTAEMLEDAEEGSRKVTVEANVSAAGEFPVTNRTAVIFHAADAYVGLAYDNYLLVPGVESTVNVLTVDWNGDRLPNQEVEVVFYRRDWESERKSDIGIYYTQWTPVDTEIDRETVVTDDQGEATAAFVPESGGTYLAVATVTDGGGRSQTSSIALWAIDENYAGWRTDPNVRTMDLIPDKQEYAPGETAGILVQSPFAQPVQAWLTVERGNLIDQRVVTVNGSQVLEVPIPPEYAPNVHVSVIAVKPATPDNPDSLYADIRMGITELVVSPEQLTLNVELTPQQPVYEPGDTAVFDVAVTDFQGNPVPAEVSLALVDLAVLSLKEDNAPPIADAFYARQPYRSNVGSGLFVSGEGLEVEVPLQGGGFGGGGGGDEALASVRLEGEEDDVRRDFKDTAYWEAKLVLDGSGRTTVEIPLPDNLTTWRLSGKAATPETLVGQNIADIQVQLPLLIRPVTPRFFTVGDSLRLGANVNNNTEADIEATVSLEAAGLTLNGPAEQTVTVPAGGRTLVQWDVTVDDVPEADMTFRVEGGGYSDASKPTLGVGPDNVIPVYRFNARDFVATAGELGAAGRRVEALVLPQGVDPRQGKAIVKLQPSLAAAVIESFDVFNENIEGDAEVCAHLLSDRLLHNTATEYAVRELGLDEPELLSRLQTQNTADVTKLPPLQKADGGWGWCFTPESDPWLSAYSLLALTKAQALGYTVDQEVIDRATGYVEGRLENVERLTNGSEVNRQAFFLYVLANAGVVVSGDADELVGEHRALLDPYAKALLAMAYDLNDASGGNQSVLLTDLNDTAILSATGAHWEDAEQDFLNLSSDIRGTAMVINALSLLQPDSPALAPAVRWLMVARKAQTWTTTHESAWSVQALADYMVASGELEADYDYALNVNLQPRAEGTFNSDNLTASETVEVPVGEMLPDESNFFDFQRGEGGGRLYYTLHLDSAISVDQVEPTSRGMTVERRYFDADCNPEEETCEPIDRIAAGQQVRVELTVVIPEDRIYVLVEDPIPAGTEAVDPNLLTSQSGAGGSIVPAEGEFVGGYWGWWYFDHIQYKDEKVVFLSQFLPAGTYQYTYYLNPVIPGTYQVMPAVARESFFPEVFGRSAGSIFEITE